MASITKQGLGNELQAYNKKSSQNRELSIAFKNLLSDYHNFFGFIQSVLNKKLVKIDAGR